MKTLHKSSLGILLFGLLLAFPIEAWSQANFVTPGKFKVLKSCQASTAIRNTSGAVDLTVNDIYTAYGENKQDGASHVHLDIDGQRKWASLSCGEYEEKPPFKKDGTVIVAPSDCLPFFDNEDNPVDLDPLGRVDVTPAAPEISPFGADVNRICGASGKETSKDEFKNLLRTHQEVLADLMKYTDGKVFGDRPALNDADSYLNDLADAWYALHAFDHIFCGEPKETDKIGGLHYYGRYLQLQESGEACRLPNFGKYEIDPAKGIYTFGVRMKMANGDWAEFGTKGYGLTLSAADILKAVTRAFAENPTSSDACILDVKDGDIDFNAVFVRRSGGILTFYPDATPSSNDDRCSKPIVLND